MRVYESSNGSFAEVYGNLLKDLKNNPEFVCSPRDQTINEFLGATLIYNPMRCLYHNERRSSQLKYIAAELVWYFNKQNSVDFIDKYSGFWKTITNPDNRTVNSAYGHLIFSELHQSYFPEEMTGYNVNGSYISQWQWAIKQLVKDRDTRQAIMHYNKPHHQKIKIKDFVCTLYQAFHIRDNKLYSTVHMRSNDAIIGLPTDAAWFSILHINMWKILQKTYPDLQIGMMKHISDSMHYYSRHENLVTEMLNESFIPINLPLIDLMIDECNNTSVFMKQLYYHIMDPKGFKMRLPETEFEFWLLDKLELIKIKSYEK